MSEVFNSLAFIVFLAVVPALSALPLGWTTRTVNLLVARHAARNPPRRSA